MTEHQIKELIKWGVDNGQRKLTKEEKELIKAAIDGSDNWDELIEVVFASLSIDLGR